MGSYDNEPGRNRKMVDELTEKLGISEKKAQMSTATFNGNVEIKKNRIRKIKVKALFFL